MRLFNAAVTREINQLESVHVWTFALELTIQGAPVPYRLVNYDQDIVFHGLTFLRFPCDLDSLEEASSAALVTLRLTIANVDQAMASLLENYWGSTADPHWDCLVWELLADDPNQIPYAAGAAFTVTQVVTNLMSATVELQAEGLTLSRVVPGRRYTTSSGYLNIPRR